MILCVSLGRSAPQEVRERLAPDPETLLPVAHPGLGELMVLSTCHRVELYATPEDSLERAAEALASLLPGASEDLQELSLLGGDEAVHHLFRVTAGLESLVVGEPQIQAQVRRALYTSRQHGAAGPVLTTLVQQALRAGRRARRDTALGAIGESLGTATARLLESELSSLAGARGLIVGAGIAAEDAAIALRARGAELVIASRNHAHAHALATRLDAATGDLADLEKLLLDAAFAVFAVAGGELVSDRQGSTAAIVDLSVPHAVAPALEPFRIDDLPAPSGVQVSTGVTEASVLVAEAAAAAAARFQTREQTSIAIRSLRAFADRVIESEVERAAADPAERERMRLVSERIAAKLLHGPLSAIRSADPRTAAWLAEILASGRNDQDA